MIEFRWNSLNDDLHAECVMRGQHNAAFIGLFNHSLDRVLFELCIIALRLHYSIDERRSFFLGTKEKLPYSFLVVVDFDLDQINFFCDAIYCGLCFVLFCVLDFYNF